MKEAVLVIIKPDGVNKGLVGNVFRKFTPSGLEIVGLKVFRANRYLAEEHYTHLRDTPFFEEIVTYLMGKYHKQKQIIGVIYYGEKAVSKCRAIAGATNPEEADPMSIRGAFGRITTKGVFENVVHVSSDRKEAEREIKLWFQPDDLIEKLYPSKLATIKKRVWA